MDAEKPVGKTSANKNGSISAKKGLKVETFVDRLMNMEEVEEDAKENEDPKIEPAAPYGNLDVERPRELPKVTEQDEKKVFRVVAELSANCKRTGKQLNIDSIYQAMKDADKLLVDATLAVLEQKGKIIVESETKTVYLLD